MGRPRLDPGQAREVTVSTKVKAATVPRIDAAAARRNVTRSEWIRRVIGEALGPESAR
jgi:hypothetical protein